VGIAVVIAVLGDPRGPEALGSFRRAWVVMGLGAVVTAVAIASVEALRRASSPARIGLP
jgi:hypothetical protein